LPHCEALQQAVVDRQWLAVDNGATSGAFDNTIFLSFHTTALGITIDVGLATGFGAPIDGKTLYSVTAWTFGRADTYDDLYFDVDSTEAFDYTLFSAR